MCYPYVDGIYNMEGKGFLLMTAYGVWKISEVVGISKPLGLLTITWPGSYSTKEDCEKSIQLSNLNDTIPNHPHIKRLAPVFGE